MTLTAAQLARLQTLCSQMAQRVAGYVNTREGRLTWAASRGCKVVSFRDLTVDQARRLIDAAQGEIGHRAPSKPRTRASHRELKPGDDALRAGRDGRKGDQLFANSPQIVTAEELEVLAGYWERLGWTQERFDAWLASAYSPIGRGRKIRTKAHANRVYWALKGMLQDAGLWADWSKS